MRLSIDLGEVVIDRPIEVVFGFISDMENGPLWGRTTRTTKETDGPVSVGTLFREETRAGEDTLVKQTEVVDCDPLIRFSYTSRYDDGTTEQARISFTSVVGGTRVSPAAEVEIPGVPQDQAQAFSREMETQVRSLLGNLKIVLESPDRPAA